jgi:hypothetical protein
VTYKRSIRASDLPPLQFEALAAWTDPETENRRGPQWKAEWDKTLRLLREEGYLIGAERVVLSVVAAASDLRQDGMLRAKAKVLHPGAVVYLVGTEHGDLRYASDAFEERYYGQVAWQANTRAIALALGALRDMDRWGVAMRGQQYTGWKALPAGSGLAATGMTVTDAAVVLARTAGMPEQAAQVMGREAYATHGAQIVKDAKRKAHPDVNGGERGQWNLVQNAEETLRRAGWVA